MGFFKRNDKRDFFSDTNIKSLAKYKVKDMMIERAIDIIAKTISRTKFEVYRREKGGTSKKISSSIDEVFYTLNLKPNINENASSFWKMVVSFLLRNGECLLIIIDRQLFMASDWETNEMVIRKNSFKNITLMDTEGNTYEYSGIVLQSDAIYMSMGDQKAIDAISDFYKDYDKVISTAFGNFRHSNAIKRVLNYPGKTPTLKTNDGEIGINEYAEKLTEGLFDEENSLTTLPEGFSLGELKQVSKNTDDFKSTIKEFGDRVANAFGIPLDIYYGTKTDKSPGTDDFITFAVLYPMSVIEDAVNVFNISKANYLDGERIRYNKFSIKHFDIVDGASSLDKLFSIGFSHNNLLSILGEPKIDDEWANRHYVTKNYMDVLDIEEGEGGD